MHANNLKPIQNLKMKATWHPCVSFELALNDFALLGVYPENSLPCHRNTCYLYLSQI